MARLRMAVIGVGHLGKEHARILAGMPDVDLIGVVDANLEQAQAIAQKHGTRAYDQCWPLLGQIDAASIVVPTTYHATVAEDFLRRGLPLLIEKPLAKSAAEAERLVDLAKNHQTFVQVGHIERFNPAFEELQVRTLQPRLIRSQRVGPFSGRSTDIGVVLDLMIHDLDLILTLVRSGVTRVDAVGTKVFGEHEDIASARVHFENGCVAEVLASRASPTAARSMQVWGPEGYAEVDFSQRRVTLMQPSEQVRRDGLDPRRLDAATRSRLREELFTRHLPTRVIDGQSKDQLSAELGDFVRAIRTGAPPRVTAEAARDAIILAEQIVAACRQHSMPAPQGQLFPLDDERQVA